jgi:hypothetical protein
MRDPVIRNYPSGRVTRATDPTPRGCWVEKVTMEEVVVQRPEDRKRDEVVVGSLRRGQLGIRFRTRCLDLERDGSSCRGVPAAPISRRSFSAGPRPEITIPMIPTGSAIRTSEKVRRGQIPTTWRIRNGADRRIGKGSADPHGKRPCCL